MVADALGLKTPLPGWPLALFRIAYGVLFIDMALQKAPWNNYGWLEGFIQKEIANPAFGWYAASVANYKTAVGSLTVFLVLTAYTLVSSAILLVGVLVDEQARTEARGA